MRVGESAGELQYELFVAPGANVSQAVVHADGGAVKVEADGSLTIQGPGGTLHETAPVSWEYCRAGPNVRSSRTSGSTADRLMVSRWSGATRAFRW